MPAWSPQCGTVQELILNSFLRCTACTGSTIRCSDRRFFTCGPVYSLSRVDMQRRSMRQMNSSEVLSVIDSILSFLTPTYVAQLRLEGSGGFVTRWSA